jgi:hypothetical protein
MESWEINGTPSFAETPNTRLCAQIEPFRAPDAIQLACAARAEVDSGSPTADGKGSGSTCSNLSFLWMEFRSNAVMPTEPE